MTDEGSEVMRGRLFRLVIAETTYGDLLRQCRARAPMMLRMAREAMGVNQQELAARLGVTNVYLSQIEHRKSEPGYELLEKLQRIWEAATPPSEPTP